MGATAEVLDSPVLSEEYVLEPHTVITRLREAMRQVMVDPAVTSVFVKAASPPAYMDQPEFAKFVEADAKRLIPVIKKIGRLDEK